jgi:hypothetical protein
MSTDEAIKLILKTLRKSLRHDIVDPDDFSAAALHIEPAHFTGLLDMLQREGYISGLEIVECQGEIRTPIVCDVKITLSGLEYLKTLG